MNGSIKNIVVGVMRSDGSGGVQFKNCFYIFHPSLNQLLCMTRIVQKIDTETPKITEKSTFNVVKYF